MNETANLGPKQHSIYNTYICKHTYDEMVKKCSFTNVHTLYSILWSAIKLIMYLSAKTDVPLINNMRGFKTKFPHHFSWNRQGQRS